MNREKGKNIAKLIRISERLPKREEIRRALLVYEKRKENLTNLIECLRKNKGLTKPRRKE